MSVPTQTDNITAATPPAETPLALSLTPDSLPSVAYLGALTPNIFSSLNEELANLTSGAAIFDLGYKGWLQITGADRLRWLNGMASNTIQGLPEGQWNYNFLLNAQGRIQGDANIYRTADALIFQTDRSQIARLSAHLDHFIIMDDVELQPLDASQTAIGIAGPGSPQILSSLSLTLPEEGGFTTASLNGTPVTLVHAHSPVIPRFEIWLPTASLPEIWSALRNSGASPAGVAAIEALRVLEATPLYGVDIQERHLAQETAQSRALNFNKGCYLGQEIVERIRSRATVHRTLHQFFLENAPSKLDPGEAIELTAEGAERNPVGEITSLSHYTLPAFKGMLALGFVRTEVVERGLPIAFNGGTAKVLNTPPALRP